MGIRSAIVGEPRPRWTVAVLAVGISLSATVLFLMEYD